MYIKDLAKEVGTSDSNLDRWAKQHGVSLNALKYPDKLVTEVCEYYSKFGKLKTQRKYPHVRIRSIVERYTTTPRQIRWTSDQLVQLARMAGLVSFEQQAAYFKRPNAHVGSIKSAWNKIFRSAGGSINGLSHWVARPYVTAACPFYLTGYWATTRGKFKQRRSIVFWVDVAKYLRSDVPPHLVSAIQTMAEFQTWLHGRRYRQSLTSILEGEL